MSKRVQAPYHLFEVSWEVCNKVGGIYTVVSSKAKTLTEKLGDNYVVIGPWLLSDEEDSPFDEEPGYEAFSESCRAMGVPVRVGRWRIKGQPLTILVEFSALYEHKDDLLTELWDEFEVDSMTGEWDYVEPVVFGNAAGRVIERWWQEFIAPHHGQAVAQFHEWMTGSGMLYLRNHTPEVAGIFTTHATMLGRSIASTGVAPVEGLDGRTSAEAADERGVTAKHSLEGTCARFADTFTTVSGITAVEAEAYHDRKAEPLLTNGIDLDVVDGLTAAHPRAEVQSMLRELASSFFGTDVSNAVLLATSGRYEFSNKGVDLLLDSLGQLNSEEGREIILFVLIPAEHAGLLPEFAQRLDGKLTSDGPLGISTHELPDPGNDPVHQRCATLELDNAPGSRVRVIQVPLYIGEDDGLFNMSYEAVLRGFDLTCFPSFYEPWGYTPQESIAVGVPTITSDFAGFGVWARDANLTPANGITVLSREHKSFDEARDELSECLRSFAKAPIEDLTDACRASALLTSWAGFGANYFTAFESAIAAAKTRCAEAKVKRYQPSIPVHRESDSAASKPRLLDFDVTATLPPELQGLQRLASNYWWCWTPEVSALFKELSPLSWESSGHSPIRFLRSVFEEDLQRCAADKTFVSRLDALVKRFDAYMEANVTELSLGDGNSITAKNPIAYYCAEFGIHESLPIYSGGLGILAGDHLKSASDLNLPLVAVGLFYRKGYMRQKLNLAGEQIAVEQSNDPRNLAVDLVRDADGQPLEIKLTLPSSQLTLRAWRAKVGRVDLYLLDADNEKNRPEDRIITERLYSAEPEMRLRQLIVLGRGGTRFLKALGIKAAATHINEGHGAFAGIERVRDLIHDEGLTFKQAQQLVRATTVFTTHTPVPAGHDRFSEDLMRRYFSNLPNWTGLGWDDFVGLGQSGDDNDFNMTYLALNFSDSVNGVSRLHGAVSRELLQPFWKQLLTCEVPVGHITNGIHLPTWVSADLKALIGAEGRLVTGDDFVKNTQSIDDKQLWTVRRKARAELILHAKSVLKKSFIERQDSPTLLRRMQAGLDDENALLIGFARRFVPYKRSALAFRDLERLKSILNNADRPVRLLFAGKAHPADTSGQELVKQIAELARHEDFIGKVFFLENYDVEIARYLVQGVDVWLNNPIRRLEASGTSGMKVAANGGLNLSILDGWWVEGYNGQNGWAIGNERTFVDQPLQNELDAENLYRLLEEEVTPLFFDRDADGIPKAWLARVKNCLETCSPMFDSNRMVSEYRDWAYLDNSRNYFELTSDKNAKAIQLAKRARRITKQFGNISIVNAVVTDLDNFHVGDELRAAVDVELGELAPDDVVVELVLGHKLDDEDIHEPKIVALDVDGQSDEGHHIFKGHTEMMSSGNYTYGIRVRAREGADWDHSLARLVHWA
ncbi:MAG: phosphorylase/glycogen(starch) synthase [Planctomycetota bacterium]|jgi:phosphorylase/glycogen(starch) synthase